MCSLEHLVLHIILKYLVFWYYVIIYCVAVTCDPPASQRLRL